MTISKETYARLTLPWRAIDSFPEFWKPHRPNYEWATNCKVFWLIAFYPLAWPVMVAALVLFFAFAAVLFAGLPGVWLMLKMEAIVTSSVSRCSKVTWKNKPPRESP